MTELHDDFQTVPAGEDPRGWNSRLWRPECKSCDWRGPSRYHPLDCGPDAVEHTANRAAQPEAVSATRGTEGS